MQIFTEDERRELKEEAEVVAQIEIDSGAADRRESAVVLQREVSGKSHGPGVREFDTTPGEAAHDPVVDDLPGEIAVLGGGELGHGLSSPVGGSGVPGGGEGGGRHDRGGNGEGRGDGTEDLHGPRYGAPAGKGTSGSGFYVQGFNRQMTPLRAAAKATQAR